MSKDTVEPLIEAEQWDKAREVILRELEDDPDNHWLLTRLSTTYYEQHDYQTALEYARKARSVVPTCPLALWDYAGALEMLGRKSEARRIYGTLLKRGAKQIMEPDEYADTCWQGKEWTIALLTDCVFRGAGCLPDTRKELAANLYRGCLRMIEEGRGGIYTSKDVNDRLRKLQPNSVGIVSMEPVNEFLYAALALAG
jgi:tetratricopeptide (TPR) repeat protein